jgi:hypothetical protein
VSQKTLERKQNTNQHTAGQESGGHSHWSFCVLQTASPTQFPEQSFMRPQTLVTEPQKSAGLPKYPVSKKIGGEDEKGKEGKSREGNGKKGMSTANASQKTKKDNAFFGATYHTGSWHTHASFTHASSC